jgi:type II secretory pathway component PulF
MSAAHALYDVVTRDSALGRIASRQVRAATAGRCARADGARRLHGAELRRGRQGIRRRVFTRLDAREDRLRPRAQGLDTASFSQDFAALIDAGLSVTEALADPGRARRPPARGASSSSRWRARCRKGATCRRPCS